MKRIAIDGPAGAGKTTVGARVAHYLGHLFIDTGVTYRALALIALRTGISPHDQDALVQACRDRRIEVVRPSRPDGTAAPQVMIDGLDVTAALHAEAVDRIVPTVAQHPSVREQLVALQRRLAARDPVVMVGRDIGTNVLPDAALKVFLTASVAERARRRVADFASRGVVLPYPMVLDEIRTRDGLDTTRETNPLRPADDAITVNTDGQTVEQVVACVVRLVLARILLLAEIRTSRVRRPDW